MKKLIRPIIKNYARLRCLVLASSIACSLASLALAENPAIKFAADPSLHVLNGKYYIYPSHDLEGNTSYYMTDWHAYSSDDLMTWKDEGVILSAADISWNKKKTACWAPDAAYRDGMYYFYFPAKAEIGVATSKSPTGPFVDARGSKLADGIDPACFIDEDGQAYLVWSTMKTPWRCLIAKLKTNMTEFDGEPTEVTGLDHFREAPWIHKRNGIYYLSYNAGGNDPDNGRICYAMSSISPTNGYTSKGVVIRPSADMKATAHHSIALCGTNWVIAYHIRGPSRFERHTCLDYLYHNADGTIQQVTPTRQGLQAKQKASPVEQPESTPELKSGSDRQ